ncbi:hypothetical protein ACF0H5_011875 [Mactra antiquata]
MTEQGTTDISLNAVSVDVDNQDEGQRPPIGAEAFILQITNRRRKIFTRVLIVAIVTMVISMGAFALGIDLLSKHKDLPAAFFVSLGGMGFVLSIFPIGMYTEGKKLTPAGRLTSPFHCCRIATLIWFSFMLCVTMAAIIMPLLSLLIGDILDTGYVIIYLLLIFGVVLTILALCMVCPICCCNTVYDYTKRYGHSSWAPKRPEDFIVSEEQTVPYIPNTASEIRPAPSAPPITDRYHDSDRNYTDHERDYREHSDRGRDHDNRGQYHDRYRRNREDGEYHEHSNRGRGRRGGRRPRGNHRGRDRLDEPRDRSDGERSPRRSRGRRPRRGRGRRHERDERSSERELTFSDEPPSYEEVLVQIANTE